MTNEDQDPEIQRLWLELLSQRLQKKTLPEDFRNRVLMKLLNNTKWTLPGSPSFENLDSMEKVLESIRLHVESGEILVLNFVFQNLMLKRPDQSLNLENADQDPVEQKRRELSAQKV